MNEIAWLAPYSPLPPHGGGRMRLWQTSRAIASAASNVTVYFPADEESLRADHLAGWDIPSNYHIKPYLRRSRKNWRRIVAAASRHPVAAWDTLSMPARHAALAIDTDVVIAEQVSSWPLTRLIDSRIPRILVAQNIESDVVRLMAPLMPTQAQRLRYKLEAVKLGALERVAFAEADVVFAMSEHDRERILAQSPTSRVEISPNGVSPEEFRAVPTAARHPCRMVFTGSFQYPPNEDAALWIYHEILPRVREAHPRTTIDIVGREPSARLRALHNPESGFNVVGEVEDVRPYLAAAAIFLMPIRVGGGTRLKALEAMAAGVPIVSTSTGVEGISLGDPPAACVADSTAELAAACIRLMDSPAQAAAFQKAAKRLVDAEYSWDVVNRRLMEVVGDVASKGKGA